jgi:hypothetical protein
VEPLTRNAKAGSDAEAELVDLLSSASPTALPEAQQRSGLQAILSNQRRSPARGRALRPAVVLAALVLGMGATAAATLGARWIKGRTSVPPSLPAPPPRPVRPGAVAPKPVAAPQPAPDETAPTVDVPANDRSRHPAAAHRRGPQGENPSALMEAVKALRQDRDAPRASRLLAAYLRQYPHGSLSEEARALSIEAAGAQNSPRAAELAQDYLRLYPQGRFRPAAERALRASGP